MSGLGRYYHLLKLMFELEELICQDSRRLMITQKCRSDPENAGKPSPKALFRNRHPSEHKVLHPPFCFMLATRRWEMAKRTTSLLRYVVYSGVYFNFHSSLFLRFYAGCLPKALIFQQFIKQKNEFFLFGN